MSKPVTVLSMTNALISAMNRHCKNKEVDQHVVIGTVFTFAGQALVAAEAEEWVALLYPAAMAYKKYMEEIRQ